MVLVIGFSEVNDSIGWVLGTRAKGVESDGALIFVVWGNGECK